MMDDKKNNREQLHKKAMDNVRIAMDILNKSKKSEESKKNGDER